MEKDKTSTIPALSLAIIVICFFARTFAQSDPPVVIDPIQPCIVPMLHLNHYSTSVDSVTFTTGIPDSMPGTGQNLDTLIKWTLVKPSYDQNVVSLRTDRGPTNTFYSANVPGTGSTYKVIVSFLNPCSGLLEIDSLKFSILIPPKPNYLYIEADTNIDPKVTTSAMLNRLVTPAPIRLMTLLPKDSQTIVAVMRDKFGNFIEFCTTAKWQVIGDSGVVTLSTTGKPYLCNVKAISDGATALIRLSDVIGSYPDTLSVLIQTSSSKAINNPQPMVIMKKPVVRGYYNLRGQKLPLCGAKHADGIVFERMIGPAGTIHERKLAAQKK